jgi:CRISPR type III-B/RAMP module-associated protein Cmr5
MESKRQGIEQELLKEAARAVSEGASRFEDYRERVQKLPVMLMVSGLAQTLTLLRSKSGGAEGLLYRQISERVLALLGEGEADTAAEDLPPPQEAGTAESNPASDSSGQAPQAAQAKPQNKKRPKQTPDLLRQILSNDSSYLKRATREAFAFSQWLKRACETPQN